MPAYFYYYDQKLVSTTNYDNETSNEDNVGNEVTNKDLDDINEKEEEEYRNEDGESN